MLETRSSLNIVRQTSTACLFTGMDFVYLTKNGAQIL
jgi:hypothetical protein